MKRAVSIVLALLVTVVLNLTPGSPGAGPAIAHADSGSCASNPTVTVDPIALGSYVQVITHTVIQAGAQSSIFATGQTVPITGTGFACNAQLTVVLTAGQATPSPVVLQVTTDASGKFSTGYTFTCPGAYQVGPVGGTLVIGDSNLLCLNPSNSSNPTISVLPFKLTVYDVYATPLTTLSIGDPNSIATHSCSPSTTGYNWCGPAFIVQDPVTWTTLQPLETWAETETAGLRGVPNDLTNAYWSRGEIRVAMFLKLLSLVNQCHTTCSPSDQAIVNYYANAVHQERLTIANKALAYYNTWESNPCEFLVPVGDPNAYLNRTDVANTLNGTIEPPCSIPPDSPACLNGGCTPPPPSASDFTAWAEGVVMQQHFRDWGTSLQESDPHITASQAVTVAGTEYDAAFGGIDAGIAYLAAKHALNTTIPDTASAAQDLQDEWNAALGDVAGDRLNELVEQSLATAFAPEIEYETIELAPDTTLLIESTLADMIASGDLVAIFDTVVGPAFAAALVIAYESWQQANNASVLTNLKSTQSSVSGQATEDLYGGINSTDSVTATAESEMLLDALVRSTMPDFTLNRLGDPSTVPAPAGPVQPSDPVFTIQEHGSTQVSSSFSFMTNHPATASSPSINEPIGVSVANGWFAEGNGPNYTPDISYFAPNGERWRAWLDGSGFLAARQAVDAGYAVVQDEVNGCPSFVSPQGGVDSGATCVVPGVNFTFPISVGDQIEMGGQVRNVTAVNSGAGEVTGFSVDHPFGADANGGYLTGDVLVLTHPDGNCLISSVLGSRVSGPDCIITNSLQLQGADFGTTTVSLHYVRAADASYTVPGSGTLTGEVLTNDGPTMTDTTTLVNTDVPAGNVAVSLVSGVANGHLSLDATGTFTYTVNPGFTPNPTPPVCQSFPITGTGGQGYSVCGGATTTANDSFVYRLCYMGGPCSYARVSLNALVPTFNFPSISSHTYGDSPFTVAATSTSPGAISYALGPGSVGCTVDPSSGQVTITGAAVGSNDCSIVASQAGSGAYIAPVPITQQFQIAQAPLTITANAKSMTYGGRLPTFDARYSGLVNNDSSSVVSGLTCGATDGQGHAVSSGTPAGSYTITCSGGTAASYSLSYATGTLTINQAPLTITASSPSITYNGTVPAITPGYGGFVNGDSAASLTTKPTCGSNAPSAGTAGTYQTSCTGAVDPNYSIGYVPGTLTINKAASSITLTSSVNPSVYGQSVTLTATVAISGPGAGNPSGKVTFMDGGADIGCPAQPVITTTETATCTTSALSVATHTITATYSGDVNFIGISTAAALTQTVNKAASSTTLTSSASAVTAGQPVTFTAAISATAPGAGTPTGSVTFKDGTTTLGTTSVSTSGGVTAATFKTSSLTVGPHAITAGYGGDGSFLASNGVTLTQYINTNLSGYPKLPSGAYNLGNANLAGGYFVGLNLSGASLSGSNLTNAVFIGANLTGANLSNSNFMSSANFTNAMLQNANLSNSNLKGANFTGVNLTGANFSNSNLTGATGLKTAALTGVVWNKTACPDGTSSSNDGGACLGHLL